MLAGNWDYWLSQMWDEAICNKRKHYVLKSDEYISDILDTL